MNQHLIFGTATVVTSFLTGVLIGKLISLCYKRDKIKIKLKNKIKKLTNDDLHFVNKNKKVLHNRNCYCSTDQKYCGVCENNDCTSFGHTCHYPGLVPYTGSWCDFHYVQLALKKY